MKKRRVKNHELRIKNYEFEEQSCEVSQKSQCAGYPHRFAVERNYECEDESI